jgi:spore germination protein YaaH
VPRNGSKHHCQGFSKQCILPGAENPGYDFRGLAAHVDFFVPMAYEFNWWNTLAGPNCPLPLLLEGIEQYGALGIPPSQLVIALPWYGHDYSCVNQQSGSPCVLVPAQAGWNHSSVVGINYHDALVLLRNGSSTTGLMYDHKTASSWFDYTDLVGRRHQVWLDTPSSLTVKVAALKKAGVRGVSCWESGMVRYRTGDGEAAAMWDAMGTFASSTVTSMPPIKTTDGASATRGVATPSAVAAPTRKISTWIGPGTGGPSGIGNDTTQALAWVRQHKDQIGSLSIYGYGPPGAQNLTGPQFNAELAKMGIDTYRLWAGGCIDPKTGSCPRKTPWYSFHTPAEINTSVAYVLQVAREGGFTGVDLDYEHPDAWGIDFRNPMNASFASEIRSKFSSFLLALSRALHADGLKLSQCVGSYPRPDQKTPAIGVFYDPAVVGAANDVVRVMNYDMYYVGGRGMSGPITSRPDCVGCAQLLRYIAVDTTTAGAPHAHARLN